MIALTRKADYALVALAYLAQPRREGEDCVSARRIAEEFNLPLALLMNILKDLAHVGLVEATRGAQGGYVLAKRPAEISLLEVVAAVEGQPRLAPCCDDGLTILGQTCKATKGCLVRDAVQRLHERIRGMLAEVTLASMVSSDGEEICGDASTAGGDGCQCGHGSSGREQMEPVTVNVVKG